MIEIKDTKILKSSQDKFSSQNTSLVSNNEDKQSMFDNMLKQANDNSSMEDKVTENKTDIQTKLLIDDLATTNKNAEAHIKIVSNDQLKQYLETKIKNLASNTTAVDKLKFIKTNQELLLNASTLNDIKEVAKNLKLNISHIASTDTKEMSQGLIFKEQLALKAKLSAQQPATKLTQSKLDNNSDPLLKKELDNNLQNQTISVVQLKEKIFDSKTKVQNFMSNIAKQMVENYKPPLTALKISLNPKELGSIDVVLKGTKNNINISFQGNPVTMDILTQNQADLRASLTKQFSQDQAFNFNFSQQQQNNNQNSEFNNVLFDEEDIEQDDIIDTNINIQDDIYL